MKKSIIALCIMGFCSLGFAQVDPCTQSTKLSGGQDLSMNGNQGMGNLGSTSYHYEAWIEGGNSSDQQLKWYGADQGGGAAFYAKWKNPNDYLARIGYYWGGSNGPAYSTLNHVYVDFNYTRSGNNTAGDYSYIGVYGWARNPNASSDEKLVEYYIVEDWFGNQWQNQSTPVGNNTIQGTKIGSVTVNGSEYDIYKKTRTGHSVDGSNTTFTQIFSVRQNQRKCGTIYVNDHVNKWNELGGLIFAKMYDLKFLAEAGGGEGWLDLSYLKLSQEDNLRGSSTSSSSSAATGGGTSSSSNAGSSSSAKTQATTCKTPLITYPTNTVPADPYTACFQYTNDKCYVCKIENESGNNTCSSTWVWNGSQIEDNLTKGYWYYEVPCPTSASSSSAAASSSSSSSSSENLDSSSSSVTTSFIKVLNATPSAEFWISSLNNGTLLVESQENTVIYLYNANGNLVQKILISVGSSVVKMSVPAGIYVVKNAKTGQVQRVLVR